MWVNHTLTEMGLKAVPMTDEELEELEQERLEAMDDFGGKRKNLEDGEFQEEDEDNKPLPCYVYGSKLIPRLLEQAMDERMQERAADKKTTGGKTKTSKAAAKRAAAEQLKEAAAALQKETAACVKRATGENKEVE